MAIDETKLNAFMGNFVNDLGAVMHAATIVVGDKPGLYKAADHGRGVRADDAAIQHGRSRHTRRLHALPRATETVQSYL